MMVTEALEQPQKLDLEGDFLAITERQRTVKYRGREHSQLQWAENTVKHREAENTVNKASIRALLL